MSGFNRAFALILNHEGGYVFHPDDPGGETNWGISKRQYPKLDIKNLTKSQAIEIYRNDYWNKVRGDMLPYSIALVVFDIAVNMGPSRAIKILQRAAGVKDDGIIGPATLKAVEALRPEFLVQQITIERILYYAGLPTFTSFGKGWIRRSVETMGAALA